MCFSKARILLFITAGFLKAINRDINASKINFSIFVKSFAYLQPHANNNKRQEMGR
jgi:hypothetical protein